MAGILFYYELINELIARKVFALWSKLSIASKLMPFF
jgi:hypothetical protein